MAGSESPVDVDLCVRLENMFPNSVVAPSGVVAYISETCLSELVILTHPQIAKCSVPQVYSIKNTKAIMASAEVFGRE